MAQRQDNLDQVKSDILNFSLDDCARGNQGYNRVLLQLFGYVGHGKSSLINSCKYVLEDEGYTMHAFSASSDTTVTTKRTAYPLTSNITIVDNKGCFKLGAFETGEVYAQLGNFFPLNKEVVWVKGYKEFVTTLENSEMDPNVTDFIVPVLVYSVKKGVAREEEQEIKSFLKTCLFMTGVFPIIVLTHKTCGDFYEVEKAFNRMGAEKVMKLDNYTEEDHLKTLGRHSEILSFLSNALEYVKFRMREPRNPKKERIDRKIILLNVIHEREINIEKEKNAAMEDEKRRLQEEVLRVKQRGIFRRLFNTD